MNDLEGTSSAVLKLRIPELVNEKEGTAPSGTAKVYILSKVSVAGKSIDGE
jgi:hypothetical protein